MKQRQRGLSGGYLKLVNEISERIRVSRYLAARSVNRESLLLYFHTGKLLADRITSGDWGDAVLEMISEGIQKNFPGIRGFSISNLKNMRQFYNAYAQGIFSQLVTGQFEFAAKSQLATGPIERAGFLQSSTAKIDKGHVEVFLHIGFTHHILLLQKCPDPEERFFYMQQAVQNQWSVEVLRYHITSNLYRKKSKISSNFATVLPLSLKKHALEAFKGEYLLNFVNVDEADGEEVLENELIKNLHDFLMSVVEFAFKRVDRPMGVATYVFDDKLPPEYRKYLPTSAQLKKATQKGTKS
jgi:predicted nuclease of restriction endonuclease-like (RecB) superfamily